MGFWVDVFVSKKGFKFVVKFCVWNVCFGNGFVKVWGYFFVVIYIVFICLLGKVLSKVDIGFCLLFGIFRRIVFGYGCVVIGINNFISY